jgi:hypothetical protein
VGTGVRVGVGVDGFSVRVVGISVGEVNVVNNVGVSVGACGFTIMIVIFLESVESGVSESSTIT